MEDLTTEAMLAVKTVAEKRLFMIRTLRLADNRAAAAMMQVSDDDEVEAAWDELVNHPLMAVDARDTAAVYQKMEELRASGEL